MSRQLFMLPGFSFPWWVVCPLKVLWFSLSFITFTKIDLVVYFIVFILLRFHHAWMSTLIFIIEYVRNISTIISSNAFQLLISLLYVHSSHCFKRGDSVFWQCQSIPEPLQSILPYSYWNSNAKIYRTHLFKLIHRNTMLLWAWNMLDGSL